VGRPGDHSDPLRQIVTKVLSSEADVRAYVLADNQLAITGSGWDPELLRLELGEFRRGRAICSSMR